jgi:hypothetical protein
MCFKMFRAEYGDCRNLVQHVNASRAAASSVAIEPAAAIRADEAAPAASEPSAQSVEAPGTCKKQSCLHHSLRHMCMPPCLPCPQRTGLLLCHLILALVHPAATAQAPASAEVPSPASAEVPSPASAEVPPPASVEVPPPAAAALATSPAPAAQPVLGHLEDDVLVEAKINVQQLPSALRLEPEGIRQKLMRSFRRKDTVQEPHEGDQVQQHDGPLAAAKATAANADLPRQPQPQVEPQGVRAGRRGGVKAARRLVASCLQGLKGAAASCFCGDRAAVDRDAAPAEKLQMQQRV